MPGMVPDGHEFGAERLDLLGQPVQCAGEVGPILCQRLPGAGDRLVERPQPGVTILDARLGLAGTVLIGAQAVLPGPDPLVFRPRPLLLRPGPLLASPRGQVPGQRVNPVLQARDGVRDFGRPQHLLGVIGLDGTQRVDRQLHQFVPATGTREKLLEHTHDAESTSGLLSHWTLDSRLQRGPCHDQG